MIQFYTKKSISSKNIFIKLYGNNDFFIMFQALQEECKCYLVSKLSLRCFMSSRCSEANDMQLVKVLKDFNNTNRHNA